jgi:hypothetical protein
LAYLVLKEIDMKKLTINLIIVLFTVLINNVSGAEAGGVFAGTYVSGESVIGPKGNISIGTSVGELVIRGVDKGSYGWQGVLNYQGDYKYTGTLKIKGTALVLSVSGYAEIGTGSETIYLNYTVTAGSLKGATGSLQIYLAGDGGSVEDVIGF